MAGLFNALRLRRNSSSFSSSASSSFFQSSPNIYASRVLFLLTLLSLSLAAFAFILQWRGGLPDSATRRSSDGEIPGLDVSRPVLSTSSDCEGILGQSRKLSFPYFRDWKIKFGSSSGSDLRPKICITTSTSAGLEQTLPWIFYHKVIGITRFFMFVEGKAASPHVSKVLESIPGVTVIYRTRELVEQQAKSRIWNETWLDEFFYRPCNYELFVKQSLNMEMGIVMAREAGMDWIFHLDTDELIHPAGTRDYSVQELLSDIPADVDTVVLDNYLFQESSVERDDIKEPFSEVSLFKKSYEHITTEAYSEYFHEACHGNANYFLTYGNGKSAARIQDHLRPNGAHRWHNYMKNPNEVEFHEAAVLHYSYSKFSDLTSRHDRCGCKPTREDVKRCFFLEFDRNAFIIASTATEEEMRYWYNEHVVWNDEEIKKKLLRGGIFTRIYSPMVIIKHLREAGVFSSVIAEAWAKKNNGSGHEGFWETYSRTFGRMFESQATARKVLNLGETKSRTVALESPPTVGSHSL